MTPNNIREQLARDEGRRLDVYSDTLGFPTCGVGHKVLPEDDLRIGEGITDDRCNELFEVDCHNVNIELDANLPWWKFLDDARQGVLQNLAFNLGIHGLLKFRKMLDAMQHADWHMAALELTHSVAQHQEPQRISRLCTQLETGIWT